MKSLKQHINESFATVNEAARYLEFKKFDEDFVKMWNYGNEFKHNTEYPNSFIAHYLYINGDSAGQKIFLLKNLLKNIKMINLKYRKSKKENHIHQLK